MKSWWRSTAAILSLFLFVWNHPPAECNRPESWSSRFRTLISEEPSLAEGPCPLEFDKLIHYPSVAQTCQNWPPDVYVNSTRCCNAVLSAVGLATAQLLNETGIFRVPDVGVVDFCLQELQSEFESQGLKHKSVDECLPRTLWPRFVTNNSLCLEIESASDFESIVGKEIIGDLHQACAGDLIDPLACSKCKNEMIEVYSFLIKLPQNSTELILAYKNLTENISIGSELDGRFVPDCFYDVVLYTAAKASTSGVWSESTAECILGVKLTNKDRPLLTVTQMVLIGLGSSLCSTSLLGFIAFTICIHRRNKIAEAHQEWTDRNEKQLKSAQSANNIGLIQYSFEVLQGATNNFSPYNLIAEGGLGSVYKGVMENGLEVAVKKINDVSEVGDSYFLNEVETIHRISHRNLVILRGWCCERSDDKDGHHRLLVYDYMPNGGLDQMLYDQPEGIFLTWENRVKIIVGIAKGLAYLHNDTQESIIHTDIKPTNILLDEELNAKLADFALARLNEDTESQNLISCKTGGTPGYAAPEYSLYGQLIEKSDVYSFGVVMLELLTGRKVLDPSKESTSEYAVTEWAASMVQDGNVWEVVDERIRFVGPKEKMQTYIMIACMCTQKKASLRPKFREVLKYLQGELPLPTMTLPPEQQHYRFGSYDWPEMEAEDI